MGWGSGGDKDNHFGFCKSKATYLVVCMLMWDKREGMSTWIREGQRSKGKTTPERGPAADRGAREGKRRVVDKPWGGKPGSGVRAFSPSTGGRGRGRCISVSSRQAWNEFQDSQCYTEKPYLWEEKRKRKKEPTNPPTEVSPVLWLSSSPPSQKKNAVLCGELAGRNRCMVYVQGVKGRQQRRLSHSLVQAPLSESF